MQISARSYLTAGMTAVVGASAIAMAPALPSVSLHSVQLPAPAIAEIALTGTSIPWEQVWNLLQTVPSGGGLEGIVNVVFSAVGTEFVTQAAPLVTAVAQDVATYLGAALTVVIGSGGLQVDFPGILSGVGTALGHGDVPGALQALTGGLSAPITQAVQTVFGPDFQAFLTGKVGTVLGALPEILRSAVQKVLGLDIKPVTDAIATALSGLLPAPGASAPVALAVAEEPTIVRNIPAIRTTESPAPAAAVVVAEAPSAPRAAAAVPAEAPAEATPVKAEAGEAPSVTVEAPVATVETEPDIAVTAPKIAHRGATAGANDAPAAAPEAATRHRGAA